MVWAATPLCAGSSRIGSFGRAATYANGELRWSFGERVLWNQHLRFMLVPFIDAGRVFDSIGDTTLEDLKFDGGIGFRLA